ncbi:LLM class flavin-dependent oxidoreductase [Spirosoma sp. RP8]|uniref:LLM class flavin-dependent oxidoreductase n=1 Tax=Spirosoma liriopis TaxID=2937440 RepID=A0ABT0HVA1_9BACT|nr:LLM class flavin-dependent oxidoreductase [Spirosoma liriopis]MCK8496078.1 LLM class flavin-dependent oxidoreductase [Spirosoma liriopis]
MKIGILEFGTGNKDITNSVRNVLEYAEHADELGYTRFWLGEHYYNNNPIWYNPEVYIPLIAGSTINIKVGVAGLLMAYHNPYKVALTFKQLSCVFPGRIDLGIAKGKVHSVISKLMSPEISLEDHKIWNETFDNNVKSLILFLNNANLNDNGVPLLPPYGGSSPSIWALGSYSANLASVLKYNTPYSRSIFHVKIDDFNREKDIIDMFRENYFILHKREPVINVAFAGFCHKSDKKAMQIRNSYNSSIITHNEIVGSPNYIYDKIQELNEFFHAEEYIFLNMANTYEHKTASIELLSNKFSLV